MIAPPVEPQAHWEPFHLPFRIGSGRGFAPDAKGRQAMRMAFFKDKRDSALVGKVWFGDGIEGPPGHVHGGVSSYVLDEAMGTSAWLHRYPAVAQKIEIEFLQMTPVGVDLDIEAKVVLVKQRNLTIEARIFVNNTVYSRSLGHFVGLSREHVERFLKLGGESFSLDDYFFP